MTEAPATGWRGRRLATHGTAVAAVAGATLRGERITVTAADDGHVRFWSLADGTERLALQAKPPDGPEPPDPTALAVLDDTLYTGWSDRTASTFDLTTGVEVDTGVRLLPSEETMRRWGPERPDEVAAGLGGVTSLAPFSPDGTRRLAGAATDGSVVLASEGGYGLERSDVLRSGQGPVWSLAAAVDDGGRVVLYAGAGAGEILRWVGGKPQEPLRFGGSGKGPTLVATLGDDERRRLVLATDGTEVVTLDPRSGRVLSKLNADVGRITALHARPDRTSAAIGGDAGTVWVRSWEGPPDHHLHVGEPVAALGSLGDAVIVGGADGGVYVLEPAGPVVADAVELQDDVPGERQSDDRLRRVPLAEALAVRLQRRHAEGRERSFLMHLDGRWGSGKTTVLNFVADQLGDGWTIVRYNAWRQSRVGPPWWTLLTALRDRMRQRRSLPGRLRLWFREMLQQRVRRASGLPATILIVVAAVAVFVLVKPRDLDAADVLTTVQGVAASLAALATLYAGAQFVAGFFGWHSARGAKAFQDLDANPMDRVADHFSWLVRQESRPIAYFIDDLDRCPAADVVELLEAVQTLVRDAGDHDDDVLSPCFVVAGDGAWIRNAFEERYREFADEIAEPGRPLGYLFLAKIFQLTMPVPRIGPVRQAEYFRELLGLPGSEADPDPAATAEATAEAYRQVAEAPNDDAQQQVLARLPQAVREVVGPTAVRRQTEPAFARATEHRLSGFAELLPDNPRAVKRFLNAFALTRSVRTVEGQAIPTGCLALWTILQTRWPLLTDALAAHPEWVDPAAVAAPGAKVPDDVRELLDDPAVQRVLTFPDGGPLTPDLVKACRGG